MVKNGFLGHISLVNLVKFPSHPPSLGIIIFHLLGGPLSPPAPPVMTSWTTPDWLKDWQKSYCPLKLDVLMSILVTGSLKPKIHIYDWPVHSKIGSTLLNGALPLSLNSHHLRELLRIDIFSKYISDNGATYYGEWPPVSKRQFCNSMIHRSHQTLHLAHCWYCYFLDAKASSSTDPS